MKLNLDINTTDYLPRDREVIEAVIEHPRHLGLKVKDDIDDVLHMLVVEAEYDIGRASILERK